MYFLLYLCFSVRAPIVHFDRILFNVECCGNCFLFLLFYCISKNISHVNQDLPSHLVGHVVLWGLDDNIKDFEETS